MSYKITVPGTFASLNDLLYASKISKGKWNKANSMKQKDQTYIIPHIRKAIRRSLKAPITLHYTFYCRDAKRDKDNIASYFTKIFQDSLVESGVLHDDGWKYIKSYKYDFEIDREYPRIEVVITETKESK